MQQVKIKWVVLGGLLLFGCAGQIQTTSTYDDSTDFAAYRTFAQAPPPTYAADIPLYSEVAGRKIQEKIANNLARKGLRPVSWDEADLQVSFMLGGQERDDLAYWEGWDWRGPGKLMTEDYVQGSLVIDIADRARERLIWHGYGSENLFSQTSSDETFKQAVDAVLAKYPPPREPTSK